MDEKVFARIEKKLTEFMEEIGDAEIDTHFFYGDHLPELMAKAAAAVWDGMEYTSHLAERVGIYDARGSYDSAEDFIKAARRVEKVEREKINDKLAKEVQPA